MDALRRLDAHHVMAILVLVGMALFLWRTSTGASLGIVLGPGGSVLSASPDPLVEGSQREVIQRYDRIINMSDQPVSSLAEIGALLRSMDPEVSLEAPTEDNPDPRPTPASVALTVERYNYRFTEQLTYEQVSEGGFPDTIEAKDLVVSFDGNALSGDVDLTFVSEELAKRPGESISVEFQRGGHQFHVKQPLTHPPLRIWSLVLFTVALAVTIVVGWRGRSDPEKRGFMWVCLGMMSLALPWALALLGDPTGMLADPLLLLFGVLALAFFRALSFEVHRRLRGSKAPSLTTALIFLPAAMAAALSFYLVFQALPALWGGAVSGDVEFEVLYAIQTSAALMVAYHILDLVLWFRPGAKKGADAAGLRWPQYGLLLSSLAMVTALLGWIQNPDGFIGGGFMDHAAGMVMLLWLGDLSLMVLKSDNSDLAVIPEVTLPGDTGARDDVFGFFESIDSIVAPDNPFVVVTRGKAAWRVEVFENPEGGKGELHITRVDRTLRSALGVFRDERIDVPIARPDDEENENDVVQGTADSLDITVAFSLFDEADHLPDLNYEDREQVFYVFCMVERGHARPGPHEMAALRDRFPAVWPRLKALLFERLFNQAAEERAWSNPYLDGPVNAPEPVADADEPSDDDATQVDLKALDDGDESDANAEDAQELTDADGTEVDDADDVKGDEGDAEDDGEDDERPVRTVVKVKEVVREVRVIPADVPYMRRDMAEAYPVGDPGLLEPELEVRIDNLVRSDAPLILIGPAGIGKEFAARHVHSASNTAEGPFIKFSVSTCPPSLRELELLGETSGQGHLGAARGGVLFVEDVAELEEEVLSRLLAEAGAMQPPARLVLSVRTLLGQPVKDVLQNLEGSLGQMARGMFSHRIIVLAPLHERPRFLQVMVDHYLLGWAMKHNKVITEVAPEALEQLKNRVWPGGVQELKAILEAAVLRCDGDTLEAHHLGLDLSGNAADPPDPTGTDKDVEMWIRASTNLQEALWRLQEFVYLEALEREEGNKSAAARQLGIKRTTFLRRLQQRGRFND